MRIKFSLLAILCLFGLNTMFAQYQKLFEFNSSSDFGSPYYAQPVFDGTYFYATVSKGGAYNKGVIFRIKPDRTDFTELLDFSGTADGSNPQGSLTLSGNVLYGMTNSGGANNKGCIFKINTDGSGYIKLLDFNGTNGRNPVGSLTISGNVLYATTPYGGVFDIGCIFKINTDGSGYARLHDFYGWKYSNNYGWTSDYADGSNPCGPLTLLGNNLYGMTSGGGAGSMGTAFLISTNGGYQKIYDFKTIYYYGGSTNYGANPCGSLTVAPDGALYGMTSGGGAYGKGCVFKMVYDPGQCYYGGYCRPASYILTDLLCFNGTNGSTPYGSLTLSGSALYGMTSAGGANNMGCIFKVNTNGSGYTNLLNFSGTANGSYPYGSLNIANGALYGMAQSGGKNNLGCMFKINTDGSNYADFFDFFSIKYGINPTGGFVKSGNALYGVTVYGGLNNMGCIYKINADGSGYKQLLDFSGTENGNYPTGSLILSGNFLYGITQKGGTKDSGVIFKINVDGSGFSKLINFTGIDNGANPFGSLILSNSVLYGTTQYGGTNNMGCIFKINTDGTGYTKLHEFSGTDGKFPYSSLILSGNLLYGTAEIGGTNNSGCIFKINTDGTGYTDIYDFSGPYFDLGMPRSLVLSGSVLYGLAGGFFDNDYIFSINTNGKAFFRLNYFKDINYFFPTGLTISGGYLYGMIYGGGKYHKGYLYQINPNDLVFLFGARTTTLFDFDGTNGANPWCNDVNIFDDAIYGATPDGGTANEGVLFKYTLAATQASTLKSFAQEDNKEALAEIKTPVDAAFDVNLYPNPNNGNFNINVTGKSGLYRVRIISTLGQSVYDKATVPGLLNVNLNNVAKGMYFISVSPVKYDAQSTVIKKAFVIN